MADCSEDYRVKAAREGKALYIPGRPAEPVTSDAAQSGMSDDMVTIRLTHEEASRLELATAEVPYLLGHAEQVFTFLWSMAAGGHIGHDDPGVTSIHELCARAYKHAAAQEGAAIDMFDAKLRIAMAAVAQAKLARKAGGQRDTTFGRGEPE
ncbi:hypothetical protein RNZ50_19435 [Paracoccaceae bacterium Fryx2]|nr:hypothetical protein [Paracoccaceae bacterium Fryx2]